MDGLRFAPVYGSSTKRDKRH